MFGDHDPNMYATSGALLPRTAVSTFCSTWSLGVASWVTWTSGCSLLYWSSSLLKLSACTSVQPCHTVILTGPPDELSLPPPPQAARTRARTDTRASRKRGRITIDTPSDGAGCALNALMVADYTRMRNLGCAFAQFNVHRDDEPFHVSTTDRVRPRGASGSSPRAPASATALRCVRTSWASGSMSLVT